MHGFNVMSTLLGLFVTLLDLNHANSITRHYQKLSSQNRTILDPSARNKPLCTTNADCPAASGETCVSGICFCNRFGWIREPHHLYSHCYQFICQLHEDCRTNFGQGSYCSSNGSSQNYCTCATEIDHVTQICADPTKKIYNSTCTHNSTCAKQYGPQAHCQYRTCVCREKFRFSQLAQKCVRVDENVNVKDIPSKLFELLIPPVSYLVVIVCVVCCAAIFKKNKKESRESRNSNVNNTEPEQPTLRQLYRARHVQAQLHASIQRNRANPPTLITFQPNYNSFQNRILDNHLNTQIGTESSSRHPQSQFAPLKPKPKSLDPPPNYVDALFDSTKVELNLHAPKDDDEDPYILNPPQEAPPLYDSVILLKSEYN